MSISGSTTLSTGVPVRGSVVGTGSVVGDVEGGVVLVGGIVIVGPPGTNVVPVGGAVVVVVDADGGGEVGDDPDGRPDVDVVFLDADAKTSEPFDPTGD